MAVETHKGRITTFLESIIPFMNTKKNTIIIKKHYRGQPFKYCFLSLRAWGVPPQLITHGLIIQGWHYYAWPPSPMGLKFTAQATPPSLASSHRCHHGGRLNLLLVQKKLEKHG